MFYLVITGSVSMEYVVDDTEIRILAFQDFVSICRILDNLYHVSPVLYLCIFIMGFLSVNDIGSWCSSCCIIDIILYISGDIARHYTYGM